MIKPKNKKEAKLQKLIAEELQDTHWLQPNMIIEEKEPFFWRISPKWAKEKASRIMSLIDDRR